MRQSTTRRDAYISGSRPMRENNVPTHFRNFGLKPKFRICKASKLAEIGVFTGCLGHRRMASSLLKSCGIYTLRKVRMQLFSLANIKARRDPAGIIRLTCSKEVSQWIEFN